MDELPIVMITTEASGESIAHANAIGACRHIGEPFTPERVQQSLAGRLARESTDGRPRGRFFGGDTRSPGDALDVRHAARGGFGGLEPECRAAQHGRDEHGQRGDAGRVGDGAAELRGARDVEVARGATGER